MDLLDVCCKSRELWTEFLMSIQQAILVIDPTGRISFASPNVDRLLGFLPEELAGRNLSLLLTPEDQNILYRNLIYKVENQESFEDELMLIRQDGSRFMALMGLRCCIDPREESTIAIVWIQDIDRQKQMERAFQQTHYEDLIKIANGIAHELRNPLVGIGGFVNRLYKVCEVIHNHTEYYGHIMDNLRKIEILVKKVEMFAALPRPSYSDTSLAEIVEKALEDNQEKIFGLNAEIGLDVDQQDLRADRSMVVRAVSIMIENALEAVSSGGRISIEARASDNLCTISITDNGCGIAPQDLPYIFTPFFSTKPSGTGIDLALAKRIAESHGGLVRAQSDRGEGTTFQLQLPIERRRPIRTSLLQFG